MTHEEELEEDFIEWVIYQQSYLVPVMKKCFRAELEKIRDEAVVYFPSSIADGVVPSVGLCALGNCLADLLKDEDEEGLCEGIKVFGLHLRDAIKERIRKEEDEQD